MVLILYRVMQTRLRDSNTKISPEQALDKLRGSRHQVVKVNDSELIAALSSINQEHMEIFLQARRSRNRPFPPS
jgi:hypothetical protein